MLMHPQKPHAQKGWRMGSSLHQYDLRAADVK